MIVIYTHHGEEFEAEITSIENGVILAKTIMENGDYTSEHELPLSEIIRTVTA
jgi:hypothetical protein